MARFDFPYMYLIVITFCFCLVSRSQGIPTDPPSKLSNSNSCQNGQIYNSSGTSFNTSCNAAWWGNDLQVIFASDFLSCIDGCSAWNNELAPNDLGRCVGVAWCRNKYGPNPSTKTCYLKWSMPAGQGTINTDIDSAQVYDGTNPPVAP